MASDDFDNDFEFKMDETVQRFFGTDLSLRALARQSGIPYSTLQAIRSGTTKNPSQRTIDRIQAGVEGFPVRRKERFATIADDTEMWTLGKLANLERPAGSTAWRLVVRVKGTNSGVASTPWRDALSSHPVDRVMDGDLNPSAILRVIWDRR